MSIERIYIDSNILIFTEEQRKRIENQAKARCDAKSPDIRKHDSDYHSFNKDRAYPHMIGYAAELAYSILTGKPVDDKTYEHGDDLDFDGIEVKGTSWTGEDPELIIKCRDFIRKKPKAYVLIRVDKEYKTAEYLGAISWGNFNKLKYFRKHKFIENWCVKLSSMEKIIPAIFGKEVKSFHLKKDS